MKFAVWQLETDEVARAPGSTFAAPDHLHLSFATSLDNLKEAMRRLKTALG